MANRKKRTVYTESQWQNILEDYHSSGLGIEPYCRRRNLGYSTFKRWQQKLQQNITKKDAFYELRRVEAERKPMTCPIRIAIKDGITLHLQNDADMAKVAEFIQHYAPQ